MGFYDFRCAVTGISLKGIGAVSVGLQAAGSEYRPVTLGIAGSYNRLGSIDLIEEDRNTELVFDYFCRQAQAGRLVLDPDFADDYGNPPRDIECLLSYFERNVSDSSEEYPAAALSGQRIFSALVARPVWTALAATLTPPGGGPEDWFRQTLGGSTVAEEIYQGRVPEVARHVRELSVVSDFLATRGLAWALPDEDEIGGQHYRSEMREYLDAARLTFHDVPAVLAALEEYAGKVSDLLDEDGY